MARNKDIVTRSVVCSNEHCGGTVYEKTYSHDEAGKSFPAWECQNCLRITPRKRTYRMSNHQRAVGLWRSLKDEWKPTDEALKSLIDQDIVRNGAMLVYGSCFNNHLDFLLLEETPSNFDVRYHAGQAREQLAKARVFVAEEKEKACPFKAGYSFQMPSDLATSRPS